MEKFNPHHKEYKKIEHLPSEEQENFVNFDNGFVEKEAMDSYNSWQNEAALANEGRSKFKKIFFPKKETYHEFMIRDAEIENRKYQYEARREDRQKMFNVLKEELIKFSQDLAPIVNKHGINLIISEDKSGRFPAEILQAAINKIYEKKGEPKIGLIGADIGYSALEGSGATKENIEQANVLKQKISEFAIDGTLEKGLLYVTEWVSTGNSLKVALRAIDSILKEMSRTGVVNIEFFGIYTMGGKIDRAIERLDPEFNSNVRDGKDRPYQGSSELPLYEELAYYSGLSPRLTTKYIQNNKNRIIRLISDLMVQEIEKEQ
jgi:hypothetical protein